MSKIIIPNTVPDSIKIKTAVKLLNEIPSTERNLRAIWNGLDDPVREILLAWFATWDCEEDGYEGQVRWPGLNGHA